jgi:hypothetical protein
MISPWGMRGKGIGFADRPVVPGCLAFASAWTGCLGLAGRAVQDGSMVLASWQAGASPGLAADPSSAIHLTRPLLRTSFRSRGAIRSQSL